VPVGGNVVSGMKPSVPTSSGVTLQPTSQTARPQDANSPGETAKTSEGDAAANAPAESAVGNPNAKWADRLRNEWHSMVWEIEPRHWGPERVMWEAAKASRQDMIDALEGSVTMSVGDRVALFLRGLATSPALVYMVVPGMAERAAMLESATTRAGGVSAYEVGTYDALRARSAAGDGFDLHHVGQAHAMEQIVSGYSRATGPAIALPEAEHAAIPTLRGSVNMSPRSLLARDIWNLREYTNTPNSKLQQLIQLNKTMYREAFAK